MNHPILYHKAKNGDLRQWETWSEGDTIFTRYGTVGGALQVSSKVAVPKNVGRSNQTSPQEQAALEARSLWQFKIDRKYSRTPEEACEFLFLPMLAHKYEDKKKKVVFPASVQPKLDGVRCMAYRSPEGDINLISRSGKPYNIPTVQEQLDKWLPNDGMILDGELYVAGMSCQSITSLVKKWKPESEQLVYTVYDVPEYDCKDDWTWEHREIFLHNNVKTSQNVNIIDTYYVTSHDDIIDYHGQFIQDGYEGAILRLYHGRYLWGYRSSELLKVKEFQDAEFKVIGANEGRGKMSGAVVWTCQNGSNDKTFECSMKVTMEERKQMYVDRADYIGKPLTVRYFNLTDDGIPRFPVGIVFRDERDV